MSSEAVSVSLLSDGYALVRAGGIGAEGGLGVGSSGMFRNGEGLWFVGVGIVVVDGEMELSVRVLSFKVSGARWKEGKISRLRKLRLALVGVGSGGTGGLIAVWNDFNDVVDDCEEPLLREPNTGLEEKKSAVRDRMAGFDGWGAADTAESVSGPRAAGLGLGGRVLNDVEKNACVFAAGLAMEGDGEIEGEGTEVSPDTEKWSMSTKALPAADCWLDGLLMSMVVIRQS